MEDRARGSEKTEKLSLDATRQISALPGRGGLARIIAAGRNSLRGIADGYRSEAAIRQEIWLALIAFPASVLIARSVWIWLALNASLLLVLAVEFLNTAIERLCNHVHPERHETIRITKDLASAAVLFVLVLAGLVWAVAVLDRFGVLASII